MPIGAGVDLLVLGGGPAGASAAIRAAESGRRVTLLEAESTPRERPGETLHPGVEAIFRELGVLDDVDAAGFLRHDGVWQGTEREPRARFEAYGADASGSWRGYQATRSVLHAILRDRAAVVGARVVLGRRAREVLWEGGRAAGVRDESGDAHCAAVVFDATGDRAWLASRIGLAPRVCSTSRRLVFGWNRQVVADGTPAFQTLADGWRWDAEVRPGVSAWCRLVEGEGLIRPGVDATWLARPPFGGPGFLLLGDAALRTDPSAGQGVLRALLGGLLAAHLLPALLEPGTESGARGVHAAWVEAQLRAAIAGVGNVPSR